MLEISSAAACDTAIVAVDRLPVFPPARCRCRCCCCCCCSGRPVVDRELRGVVAAACDVLAADRQAGDTKNASQEVVADSSRSAAEDRADEVVHIFRRRRKQEGGKRGKRVGGQTIKSWIAMRSTIFQDAAQPSRRKDRRVGCGRWEVAHIGLSAPHFTVSGTSRCQLPCRQCWSSLKSRLTRQNLGRRRCTHK